MEPMRETRSVSESTTGQTRNESSMNQTVPLQVSREFLIFGLAGEEYDIDILSVREIRSYEPPTQVANASDHVKSVVNLRGIIVPILDLRLKFGLKSEYTDFTVVIVLNLKHRIIGLIVDAVSDVLALDSAHIRAVPQLGGATNAGFITGIGSAQPDERERMLILVDGEQLVSSSDNHLLDICEIEQLALH